MKLEISDQKHNLWDLIFKFGSGIFVLIAFCIGLKQFKVSSELEFKKIYYTNQIQYVNELIATTSELCKDGLSDTKTDSLTNQFRSLYYGKVDFYLNNGDLKTAITEFSDVADFNSSKITTYKNASTKGVLKEKARKIAQLAKQYIDKLYEVHY